MQRSQWRFFTGLEHHRIAGCQRRGDLPGGHDHRVIPGHDHAHHPHGLPRDQCQSGAWRRCDFVVHLVHGLAIPAQAVGGTVDVNATRIADRFAHVQRFGQGQFLTGGEQQIGKTDHDSFALSWRQAAPALVVKRSPGRTNRRIDVRRVAAGDLGQQPTIDRREAVEGGPGSRPDPLAIDQGTPVKLAHVGRNGRCHR